tara:strand:+ start:410 stop:694 length:285 start_codon:yes stop_codon:yes gene_type:complete
MIGEKSFSINPTIKMNLFIGDYISFNKKIFYVIGTDYHEKCFIVLEYKSDLDIKNYDFLKDSETFYYSNKIELLLDFIGNESFEDHKRKVCKSV